MPNGIVEDINQDKTELYDHGFALTGDPELKTSGGQVEIRIRTVDMATGGQYVFTFIGDRLFIVSHDNSMITFRVDLPTASRRLDLLRAIIDGGIPFDYDFTEALVNAVNRTRGHEDMMVTPTNGDILMPMELARNWAADGPVGKKKLRGARDGLLQSMRDALDEVTAETGVDLLVNDVVYTYATGIMGVLKSHLFPLGIAFAYGPSFDYGKDRLTPTTARAYDLHLEWLTGKTENAIVGNADFKIGKTLGYRNMVNMFVMATSPRHYHYDMLQDFKQFACKVQDDGHQADTISRAIMGIFMKPDDPVDNFRYDYNQTGRYAHSIDHYSTPLDAFHAGKYKAGKYKPGGKNTGYSDSYVAEINGLVMEELEDHGIAYVCKEDRPSGGRWYLLEGKTGSARRPAIILRRSAGGEIELDYVVCSDDDKEDGKGYHELFRTSITGDDDVSLSLDMFIGQVRKMDSDGTDG